jgi:hypothetical protein
MQSHQLTTFWLNVCNLLVLHALIEHGSPLHEAEVGVRDGSVRPISYVRAAFKLLSNVCYRINGLVLSALDIEHSILRAHSYAASSGPFAGSAMRDLLARAPAVPDSWRLAHAEPMVTFLLSYATAGSPPVVICRLDSIRVQFQLATRLFLERTVRLDPGGSGGGRRQSQPSVDDLPTIWLPAVIQWHHRDFGADPPTDESIMQWVLAHVGQTKADEIEAFLEHALSEQLRVRLAFTDFDWSFMFSHLPDERHVVRRRRTRARSVERVRQQAAPAASSAPAQATSDAEASSELLSSESLQLSTSLPKVEPLLPSAPPLTPAPRRATGALASIAISSKRHRRCASTGDADDILDALPSSPQAIGPRSPRGATLLASMETSTSKRIDSTSLDDRSDDTSHTESESASDDELLLRPKPSQPMSINQQQSIGALLSSSAPIFLRGQSPSDHPAARALPSAAISRRPGRAATTNAADNQKLSFATTTGSITPAVAATNGATLADRASVSLASTATPSRRVSRVEDFWRMVREYDSQLPLSISSDFQPNPSPSFAAAAAAQAAVAVATNAVRDRADLLRPLRYSRPSTVHSMRSETRSASLIPLPLDRRSISAHTDGPLRQTIDVLPPSTQPLSKPLSRPPSKSPIPAPAPAPTIVPAPSAAPKHALRRDSTSGSSSSDESSIESDSLTPPGVLSLPARLDAGEPALVDGRSASVPVGFMRRHTSISVAPADRFVAPQDYLAGEARRLKQRVDDDLELLLCEVEQKRAIVDDVDSVDVVHRADRQGARPFAKRLSRCTLNAAAACCRRN